MKISDDSVMEMQKILYFGFCIRVADSGWKRGF